MKISVKVKTGAKKVSVKKMDDNTYVVRLTAQPIDGKANDQLVKVLSEYFSVPKSLIRLLKGARSKLKIIQIS